MVCRHPKQHLNYCSHHFLVECLMHILFTTSYSIPAVYSNPAKFWNCKLWTPSCILWTSTPTPKHAVELCKRASGVAQTPGFPFWLQRADLRVDRQVCSTVMNVFLVNSFNIKWCFKTNDSYIGNLGFFTIESRRFPSISECLENEVQLWHLSTDDHCYFIYSPTHCAFLSGQLFSILLFSPHPSLGFTSTSPNNTHLLLSPDLSPLNVAYFLLRQIFFSSPASYPLVQCLQKISF